MQRIHVAGVRMLVLLVAVTSLPAGAAANINACKLLTPADLEAALHQKVTQVGIDSSGAPGGGPLQGVTQFVCYWWVGGPVLDDKSTYVLLNVLARPAQTPAEQGAVSRTRSGRDAVETVKITGGDCRAYKIPSGRTPISCYVEAKGLGLFLDVTGPGSVPIAQVKPLVDKAVSRLP